MLVLRFLAYVCRHNVVWHIFLANRNIIFKTMYEFLEKQLLCRKSLKPVFSKFLYPLDEKIKYMNKVLVFSVLKYRPIILESSPTHVGAVPKLCLRRTNHVENMSRSKNHQLDKVEVVVDVMEGCPRLACSHTYWICPNTVAAS